jgi:two-component system OmpR family response regulator
MNDSPHILVVDDHQEIRDLVARHLKKEGFRVDTAADGKAMWRILVDARIDLIVLDLMLPGEDGLALCRKLRAEKPTAVIPIIMLTAKGEEIDRVLGLEMGADDYMAKPFSARELVARIKAVLRRSQGPAAAEEVEAAERLRFAGWTLDVAARHLEAADGTLVPLSTGEYDLLMAFVQRPGRVLNRDQLLDLTRGRSAAPFDRSIDTQVSRLRKKIEPDAKDPTLVKTVWGGGYVFTPAVERG